MVLFDLQGSGRAFLLRISQARSAGYRGALLQHLRTAAGQAGRRASVHDFHGATAARRRPDRGRRRQADPMLELFGSTRSKIRFVSQEEVYGKSYEDIPRRVPDNTKMRTLLGCTPKVSLREGLARTIEWFRSENGA